ncbi:prephenate dehydratase [Candidatus Zixiibacteriota bacterium]
MKYEIAFQGEHYSYSEIAAKKFLDEDAICHPTPSFDEVFQKVVTEKVALGIIPIENTLYGSIHRNFDLLLENEAIIVGEVNLRIELHLIALPGVNLDQVKTVYSHPAALEQCRRFFREHPDIEGVSSYDTAGSVKIVSEKKQSSVAAIASRWAAKDYGMAILRQEIEDFPENFTRFLIVSKKKYDFGLPSKTSIVFSTRDIPGALFKSLSVFFLRDINLMKIESRPLRGKPWEYLFYLDFSGDVNEERCTNALRHLEEIADFIKVLGSYPSVKKHADD